MKRTRKIGGVSSKAIADGVADVATRQYAAPFMERGGPAGRARSEVTKGKSIEEAIATASKQGKGHWAEIAIASQQSVDAGTKWATYFCQPNAVANDAHVDLEVISDQLRVLGIQVGVGGAEYLRRKAMHSAADLVVVNAEGREALLGIDPAAHARTVEQLTHDITSSRVLRGDVAESEAKQVLHGLLTSSARVPEWLKLTSAAGAGLETAAVAFARHLFVGVANRFAANAPLDESLLEEALYVGGEMFVRGTLETYAHASDFLQIAGDVFDGKLLHLMGQRVVIGSAIVDVVIETAKDMVAWSRGELTSEAVARLFGVSCFGALGSVLGALVAARIAKNFGPLAPVVMLLGAWGGGKLGELLGEKLLLTEDFRAKAMKPPLPTDSRSAE
jgi:hypothetical protein